MMMPNEKMPVNFNNGVPVGRASATGLMDSVVIAGRDHMMG